mmetsp:Transcript_2350/g.3411  ORF Transcript_2350/g.3411 Transcript_2350/m.3411 type:complete len:115 (+) Transcript_2350:54-398(+)
MNAITRRRTVSLYKRYLTLANANQFKNEQKVDAQKQIREAFHTINDAECNMMQKFVALTTAEALYQMHKIFTLNKLQEEKEEDYEKIEYVNKRNDCNIKTAETVLKKREYYEAL